MSWDPNQGQGQNPYQQGPYGGNPPPQQPGNPYGQSQYGPQGQYGAPAASASVPGASSTGLQPNVAAGLGYLVGIIGIIFFFIEKRSRFVRFHGGQTILIALAAVAWTVVYIILIILGGVLSAATNSGAFFLAFSCLGYLAYIALGVGALVAMIQAFMGKYFKLPLIGNIADRWANAPGLV